ncbi:RCC1 and BTB domain-containing protein 2 [Hondaea fermentalgiana]|uniref:RCC1 and BTB domain-containing protein 2 n=1 Tax=Hondaea fermentalgiana TaxID=2315210 RepID=A0A2R5GYL2_9STRA|nr:RCC1 and BTB domain-containing protein 2 [Hondaea fermentalgiana]|eukprot:GBG33074.1 RCC1 and BTB domain-containing protein 2 [Hondaea fermentalgiana]
MGPSLSPMRFSLAATIAEDSSGPWLGLGANRKEDLEDVSSPTQIELDLESEESLVQVSCGKEHMVCCSSNGACWTWGADNEDGKLGHVMASASGEPYFITLQELSDNVFLDQRTAFAGLRMARQAAREAIDHSSLCDTQMEASKLMMRVLDEGQRFPFAEHGVSYLLDDCVTGIIDARTGESLERSRAEGLEIEEGEEGGKEERVTSDRDTQEILFVRANQEACWAPRRVMLLRGRNITRVAAGMRHSLFLTSNGTVLASGNNQHGQLGLGTELVTGTSSATIFVPTKVPLKAAAKDIAAGASHSVALGENQHVYTWGHGDLIGRPDGDPYRPEEICFEGGPLGLVRHIAVGDAHTVVSTAFGHCIGFGRNPCCQLGMSSPNELIDIPTLIDTSLGSKPKSLQKKAAAGGNDDGVPDFASLNPQNDDNLIIMGIAAGGGLAQDTGHTLFLSSSLQLADPESVDFASTSAFSQPLQWQ